MINRFIDLPSPPNESFFLWGPRQAGKSYWLRNCYPHAYVINLLRSDIFAKYVHSPSLLREELLSLKTKPFVIIDEIQKIPALLDEVHLLIEEHGFHFGLCGSSARKLKRGHANLLGGRALRYVLNGFSGAELGNEFSIQKILNHGYLPNMYLSTRPKALWRSYVGDYLKEEIAAEAATRNLPAFSEFLRLASLGDTEIIEFEKFASDCGVSSKTIKNYFEILQDTLLGSLLPGYTEKHIRRTIQTSKFYFFDVGLVNYLAGRKDVKPKTEVFGKAFENWVFHEIRCYLDYKMPDLEMFYWRLSTGVEVDFVVDRYEPTAIEAKSTARPAGSDFKSLYEFQREFPHCKKRIMVCNTETSRKASDGILILSPHDFLKNLWAGEIV